MIERIEGIVTEIIRHNDAHNVVTLFTRTRGRMAFLVPVGKSKSGRLRNSVLNLMAVVGADVNLRPGKELHPLRQVHPLRLWHGIYSHPVKSSLLFFLTEFSHRLLRQYPADERLWDYLIGALELLDGLPDRELANFHIAFLIRLLPLVGILPVAEKWLPGMEFDMLSGEMVDKDKILDGLGSDRIRSVLLSEGESRLVPLLARMNFTNMSRFRFTPSQRYLALERMLAYYSVHLPLGTDFKTLPVLRELFS